MTPEARARQTIDALLTAAGWHVCDVASANLHEGSGAVKGVALREFPLNPGHCFADYLLYVNGKACGVIEAKKEGATLSGVEVQSARYAQGLPAALPAWRRPLPFVFESAGVEQLRIVAEVDRHLSILRGAEAEFDGHIQRAKALRQATLAKCVFRESHGVPD